MSDLKAYYANVTVKVLAYDAEEAEALLDEAVRQGGVFQINPNLYGSILCNRLEFVIEGTDASEDDWVLVNVNEEDDDDRG